MSLPPAAIVGTEPPPPSVVQLFEAQVQQHPDLIALRYQNQQLSYVALNQRANALAHCLRQHGCQAERLVGLCLPRSIDAVVALLAIFKTGAAYLPLDPGYPPQRLHYMLADARPHLIVTDSSNQTSALHPGLAQLCMDQIGPDQLAQSVDASSNLPACQLPQHLAYVIYTSGSTGQPKGTQLCHGGLHNLILAQQQAFALAPGARVLQFASLNFDASVWEIVMALASGATLCLADSDQLLPAAALQATIAQHAITHLTLPPVVLAMLEPAALATVQTLIVAGEACPPLLAAQWAQGRRFFNAYGPTESTVCASLLDCAALSIHKLPSQLAIGQAIHGISLQVLDDNLHPVPAGQIGQLAIGGVGLARGYLGRAALTAEKFIPDPAPGQPGARLYLSGDLASWQADGNLAFHGRIDQQIKLRGMRIEPGEIEAALSTTPWVQQACVLAHPAGLDQPSGAGQGAAQQLVAWVVADYAQFGDTRARQQDNTAHWGQASDDIYQGATATDAQTNFSGWYSSYDRTEIPAHDMQEWLDHTVSRIRALSARRILEIGCGAGLLLHRLAPACERYHGVDLSPVVIAQLQATLAAQSGQHLQADLHANPEAGARPACHITLAAAAADAVAQGLSESFDTVIINSVAQYFPSLAYLDQVLQAALSLLHPTGGQIFIGDVRHLGLHRVFHSALALHQAQPPTAVAQIRSTVARSMAMETELLLDPRYFFCLQQQYPQIVQVQILPKAGQARNELTKFRYDVVLTLAHSRSASAWQTAQPGPASQLQPHWQTWQADMNLAWLDATLAQPADYLALRNLPDERIAAENAACHALGQAAPQQSVEQLLACLPATAPAPGLAQLTALGQRHGYILESSVAAGEQGGLHLVWHKTGLPIDWRAAYDQASSALANIPSLWQLQQAMQQHLLAHLQQVLPQHMVPAHIVFLPQMPINANGKIDRLALPAPDLAIKRRAWQAARNPDEQTMVDIWSEVLKLPQIGIHDDFFALGGHSLLATQVISRVRLAFQVEISLRTLFAAPTLLALLQQVQNLRGSSSSSNNSSAADSAQATRIDATSQQPEAPARESGTGPLPLSFAQQRLWFLDQLDSSDTSYHIPLALRLRGVLDQAALQRAIQAIVARHEVLRTCLIVSDASDRAQPDNAAADNGYGQAAQLVLPHLTLALPLIDLRHLDPTQQEAQLQQRLQQQTTARFDLARGPLLRLSLVRLSSDNAAPHHVLLLTMHHLISDGWSMALWAQELGCFYQAELSGQAAKLPPLPWQYADFARWQRQWLQGQRLQQQLDYWRQRLAGAPGLLNLPLDHVRPARPGREAGSVDFHLPATLLADLQALGRQHQASLFMTLCAALQLLLARYSGQNDICIGTPIANRHHARVENLIGFFVNTLVLRSQIDLGASFTRLLQQVQHHTLDAYAHQDLPFEQLVEALQPERHISHTPLFQVMLVLHNTPPNLPVLPGLEVAWLDLPAGNAKFDLSLSLTETPQGLQGRWEYRCDLFDAASVARMAQHFTTLLHAIVAQPDCRAGQLDLISQSERLHLVRSFNPAPAPEQALTEAQWQQFASLPQRFEAQVARFPQRIAVQLEQSCLSYQQLNQRANQLAHYLIAQGVQADTLVGLCLERTPDLLVAILAILKAGGAYLPLDPHYPAERLAYMLADARPLLLLTTSAIAAQADLPPEACPQLWLDEAASELQQWPPHNPALAYKPQQLAYVIYTSGSTGKPKGTQLAHHNVLRLFAHCEAWFGFDQHDVWTLFHSCAFDFSVWEIWGALLYGGKLLIVPYALARSPEQMHALLQTQGVTILNQTPTAFQQLVQADAACPQAANWRLRHIIFGGEALNQASLAPWLARYGAQQPALSNMYGITETTVHVTFQRLQLHSTRPLAIGRPIADLQVYILDDYLQPVPPGVPGQLFVAGAGLARGYLKRPALSAERFIPNPFASPGQPGARMYQSGDLARYLADGSIEYLGRIDQQVKIRGFRIELGEIEAALTGLAADSWPGGKIAEAVVLPRKVPGTPAETTLLAYYVLAQARQASSHLALQDSSHLALRGALRQCLPDYMVPGHFVALPALPLTANGKVDRNALPWPLPGTTANPAMPDSATLWPGAMGGGDSPQQQLMCQIWSEVLQCPLVGPNDDFFALGGHSLLATRLISRIRQVLEVDLPLRTLFEAPTVASLLQRLEQQHTPGISLPLFAALPQNSVRPLSFAQQRLWFLDQLETRSALYHIPLAWMLDSSAAQVLDLDCLQQALHCLMRRHESLRVGVAARAGQPCLNLLPQPAIPLERLDWPDCHDQSATTMPQSAQQRLQQRLQQHWQTGFDLAQGPLWRVSVCQLGPYRHLLLLTLHHIIADGWSIGILLRDLASLYRALKHKPDDLEPDAAILQYSDFAAWQRQCLDPAGPTLPRQLAYWRQQLQGCPNLLDLPLDHPRPAVPSHRGASLPLVIEPPLLAALQQLSRQQQVTLFMTLCAAWQLLLARYSGQSDICIGTPIAGRNHAQTEGICGLFVNTLVLRSQIDLQATVSQLLAQVRHTTLEAYAHQDLPFEQLLEALQPERHVSYSPLFQVMLALQNTPPARLDLPGVRATALPLQSNWAKFDLSLSLGESADVGADSGANAGLQGMLEYSLDLFEPASMVRLLRHFKHLLAAMVAAPQARLGQLALMDPAEQRALLEYNWPVLPQGGGLLARFEAHTAQHGAATALEFEATRLSYAELNAAANQLARHLQHMGAGPEQLLGICLPRCPHLVVTLLAVMKSGAAWLPLDPDYPAARLQYIIDDARPSLILSQQDLFSRFSSQVPRFCPAQNAALLAGYSSANLPQQAQPQHLAYVIYTSGSTGKPKGTQLGHAGLTHLLQAWQLPPHARLLQFASFNFDASVWEIGLALSGGATLCMSSAAALLPGPALQATLQQCRINSVILPPVALAMLEPQHLPQLQTIVLGGEACPQALVDAWLAHAPTRRIFNAYGPTEATVCSTLYRCQAGAGHNPPIGRALGHVHALVLDELLQPQPPGVAGQLYLAGPALARGYLNRPDLSASSFVPHPYSNAPGQRMYASGDLVRQLADGNLAYLGRIDQQVKLRGLRIELGEIETILASWPWVREALVLVSGEAGQDRQIVAWLVLAAGRKLPPLAQLRENLLTLLPDYMVPSHFIALDAMPLTPNGKIDRNALPQPDLSRSDVPYQAPDSRTEILLAEIWGQLLQRQRISVHDDFFALGGHSLLAVQMVSLLQQQGGPAIPVREVFTHAVLAALAAHIDSLPGLPSAQQDQAGAVAGAGSALCLPVRPGSTSPPLFLIHPIGGEAAYAWALAPHLPAAMPVFALRARGLVAGETPHTSLPAMARDYLAQIRQIQPHGPYYLAGWSLGGNIAWEIAHQCRQAGQVVGFLGLIDSAPAAVLRQQLQAGGGHWDEEQAFWVWLSQQSGVTPAAIDTLQTLWQTGQDRQSGTPAFASLLAASQTQGLDLSPNLSRLAAALTPELVQAQVALYHASGLAILHWQQPGLDCALHLYCAGPDTQLAWASADGYDQIDCKLIGGDHFSIVQPPLLEQLGRAINCDLLARLQARPRANIKPSP